MTARTRTGLLAALVCCGALVVTGCGAGDSGSAEVSASPESSEGASQTPAEQDEAPASEEATLVDVLVVSYQPGNTIMSIGSSATGSDSCAIAVDAVLGGGNSVELQVEGEDTPRTARLEPSATNGESLPCRVEATFEDVPSGAASYTATQVGGSAAGLYSDTVTATQLAAAGYQIDIVEEEKGYSLDAILDATCLEGQNTFKKVYKNYSQFSGPGRGDDIWVESRVRLTNNCDKNVKAVTYKEVFTDVFGDTILSCEAKYTINIKKGTSKETPRDRGCLVNTYNDNFGSWETAKLRDISSSVVVDQIVFFDGSKIDSGL
jgi:hypothetical protein